MPPIRVHIVDDHKLIRDGIVALLKATAGISVIGESDNGQAGVDFAHTMKPDVVLMDIDMPTLNGIDATRLILKHCLNTKVVALSMHTEEYYISEMLLAGATGYITKDCPFDELITCIRAVNDRRSYLASTITDVVVREHIENLKTRVPDTQTLTGREREVIQYVAQGKSSKEVAEILGLSVNTVLRHRHNVMEKFCLKNTADLTRYAIRMNLIVP